jgi:hypothetical protein
MKTWPRKFLAVAVAVALLVSFWRRPPAPDELPLTAEPAAEPWPDILVSNVAKSRLARDAATGRRSLVEAAALFRELNRLLPASAATDGPDSSGLILRLPRDTEEGRLCWQVVTYADAALSTEAPGRAAAAVDRLEAEYFAELRAHGAVRLPDPASLEPVGGLLRQARVWIVTQEKQQAARGPGGADR